MTELSLKLVPLLALIAAGWVAGKYLGLTREALAPTLIYLISPLTIFKGVLDAPLSAELLLLPFLYIALCSIVCGIGWGLGGFFFKSPARNILAYAGGNSNSGYFGFPAAAAFLGPDAFSRAVMISFGFVIYEATVGFFVTARGHHTVGESFRKVLRLPQLYVFAIGLALNAMDVRAEGPALEFFDWVKGSFLTFGMMLIGVAMAQIERLQVDWIFTSFAFVMKFLVWPLVTVIVFWIDRYSGLNLLSLQVKESMWLVSVLPMAANTVAFASLLRAEPEKCAVAVLLSTLVCLALLPLAMKFPAIF